MKTISLPDVGTPAFTVELASFFDGCGTCCTYSLEALGDGRYVLSADFFPIDPDELYDSDFPAEGDWKTIRDRADATTLGLDSQEELDQKLFEAFFRAGDEAGCESFFDSSPNPGNWLKTRAGKAFLKRKGGKKTRGIPKLAETLEELEDMNATENGLAAPPDQVPSPSSQSKETFSNAVMQILLKDEQNGRKTLLGGGVQWTWMSLLSKYSDRFGRAESLPGWLSDYSLSARVALLHASLSAGVPVPQDDPLARRNRK